MLNYLIIRIVTYPLSFLNIGSIRFLGKGLGSLGYLFLKKFRKRTLSNLSLAKELNLEKKELISLAKRSFQNLAINLLEYPYFEKKKGNLICENPKEAQELYDSGKGIVFFCGHLANWETLFLEGTQRMKGLAIAKPLKNPYLNNWVLRIRQKYKGRIVSPKHALKEGLKALKEGVFLGIVGDQGMPDSPYSFPLFGRRAFFSTAPALLAYKANSPIIVATARRTKEGYAIHYSDPLWPDLSKPLDEEIKRLMDHSLKLLQKSIKPDEWLWQHNCYKQQLPGRIKKTFRHEAIAVVFGDSISKELLFIIKELYPREFITIYAKKIFELPIECEKLIVYNLPEEIEDWQSKLVFNFSPYYLKKNFPSAFKHLTLEKINALAKKRKKLSDLKEVFKLALCQKSAIS